MNKGLIMGLSLLLAACVTSPDLRPEPYLKTEELLHQGITAYKEDNFTEAQQKFSRALEIYQSFANDKGIALAQLNLLETVLAVGDFATAEVYLKKLKQQAANDDLEAELKRKVVLLEVKFWFEQQHYPTALATLQPLLVELDAQKITDDAQLNLLATQARLEVLISPLAHPDALDKFTAAVRNSAQPAYQMLLKRLLAVIAVKRGDYQTASNLLKEVLTYYKEQANRRLIATCFEELAAAETAQGHTQAAQDYLQKALVIWEWLKNDYKSGKIRAQLKTAKKQ